MVGVLSRTLWNSLARDNSWISLRLVGGFSLLICLAKHLWGVGGQNKVVKCKPLSLGLGLELLLM